MPSKVWVIDDGDHQTRRVLGRIVMTKEAKKRVSSCIRKFETNYSKFVKIIKLS